MREFVALIRQGPDGIYYDVTFADLPSVRAAGRTLERARRRRAGYRATNTAASPIRLFDGPEPVGTSATGERP